MISKVTGNDFNESTGNRILQGELEKNHRIKTFFNENDKTPNTDGYFEVLDRHGTSMKRFVVQIKTVNKLRQLRSGEFSYSADTAFLQYILENIDQNPAVFFIVDIATLTVYFKFLSLDYLLSLKIGQKHRMTLHLNKKDSLNEDAFFSICMSIIRQSVVDTSVILTEKLLPNSEVLYHYEHIDEAENKGFNSSSVDHEESINYCLPSNILKKYCNIKIIGVGGMSKVYSLTSKISGNKVALKVAPMKDPSMKLLLDEYLFFDRLRHPAIPRVLDYFEENETEYMLMDYVGGHDLRWFTARGAFDLTEIIAIIDKLCGVVDFLYEKKVLHGDIKPSNILIGSAYSITLIDFGAAESLSDANSQKIKIVTPRYTAPECFSLTQKKTIQSEIYSIGATLYYSLNP